MEGHIFIDGEITSNHHLEVKRQIEALGNVDTLVVHIQSPGGSVYAGYNTYNVLKSSGKKIKAIIEGEAQSMATFISLAADKGQIEIKRPSTYMIHNPSSGLQGDADALSNGAEELRKIEAEMAEAYSVKTGIPIEEIKAMMKKETRMNAEEAVQRGFADTIHDQLKAVAFGTRMTDNDKTLAQEILGKIEGLFKKFAPAANGPTAMDLALKGGGMMNIMSENGDLMQKPATVDGQPAPDGPHELEDGRVVVTMGGMVTEVKEAMSPEQKQIADLKAQISALQAEKDAAVAAQTAAQTQVQTATQAMEEIKQEVVALKKLTVGDPNPAGRGNINDPTIKKSEQEEVYRALQKEILQKAGILNN